MDYVASDEKQVKDKAKKFKNTREQELEDVKDILKNPAGVRFFKRIMTEGSVFTTTFTGNSQTFFKEGARNLALKFLGDVAEAAPNKFTEIIMENKK